MLLSLFCGAGGLDLGFEQARFTVGLAFDKKFDSVESYNHNRPSAPRGHVEDVNSLTLARLDELWGSQFEPTGLVGGPPCQSFSQANRSMSEEDPRHTLPLTYAKLLKALNARKPVEFFVMENVKGLRSQRHLHRLNLFHEALVEAGFHVTERLLNAANFGTPQNRERLFIVGLNRSLFGDIDWQEPLKLQAEKRAPTVRSVLQGLPEPVYYSRDEGSNTSSFHKNHWCMAPKSRKFHDGTLRSGNTSNRSFKTLAWDKPSITVAYGHREVHVHPRCHRRLSVYEAMQLQGFPHTYELIGSLSSQIDQVSEAVPPPMAYAVAKSIASQLRSLKAQQVPS